MYGVRGQESGHLLEVRNLKAHKEAYGVAPVFYFLICDMCDGCLLVFTL